MAEVDFDDFLRGVQLSVAKAQANIAAQNKGRLEHLVQVDENGHTERLDWSLVLDVAGTKQGEARTIRLPLASMRPMLAPQVTEFALEVQVSVEPKKPRSTDGEERLRLVIHERRGFLRRQLHNLKISLFGPQPGAGIVEVDGKTLKVLPASKAEGEDNTVRDSIGSR